MTLTRGLLRQRPRLDVEIRRVSHEAWKLFAPFHYLTADLHKAARCFALYVGGRIASFAGVMHRPHPKVRDIQGVSRLVTLPDWQGLGLAMILVDKLGAAFKALDKRLHTYPAHPSLIRSFDHSQFWKMEKKSGSYSSADGRTSSLAGKVSQSRPCAVFSYQGEAMDAKIAQQLVQLNV